MDPIRIGKFTSSKAINLVSLGTDRKSPGKGFHTYIKKTNQERKLGRSLDAGDSGRACKWGSFVEKWLMYERPEIIGMEYTLSPKLTEVHELFPDCWAGSRDGKNNSTGAVVDIKAPFTLESFCDFADCDTIEQVRANHKDGEKYYWQLVSNACIAGTNKAELIIFVPNVEELQAIQEYAMHGDHERIQDVYFIGNAVQGELPFINDLSQYPGLKKFRFDIPDADKQFLTARVVLAARNLIDINTTYLHIHEPGLTVHETIS